MGQRQSITFTVPQEEYLGTEAARLGISISELVRRIVDAYRQQGVAGQRAKGAGPDRE